MPIWLLLQAMKKCPPFQGRLVFRGIKNVDIAAQRARFQRVTPAQVIRKLTWYQFSSTSLNMDQVRDFLAGMGGRVLFAIELTTGRGRCVWEYSCHSEEREVLLPPGTRFEVLGTICENNLLIVQLLEVPPSDPIIPFPLPSPVPVTEVGDGRRDDNHEELQQLQVIFVHGSIIFISLIVVILVC